MDKNKEIKFVGQPIFKQIINLIDAISIKSLVKKHNADHYYKAFKAKTQLITVLFGILSRCDSVTEICEGLRALGGKLNHLGLERAPAKSTACDGMRNRDNKFFEDVYFGLVQRYKPFLSDSRTFGLTFKEILLIDSTTIRLFSDILKGVGRNPKTGAKVEVPPKRIPFFKPGKELRDLVDGGQTDTAQGRAIKVPSHNSPSSPISSA